MKNGEFWHSKINPEAFSYDGGRTYFIVSENRAWWRRWLPKVHKSYFARGVA